MIRNSYELYRLLEKKDLLANKPPVWWPNYGSFEVIVGAILTQNSQWTRVEKSLQNLEGELDIESLCGGLKVLIITKYLTCGDISASV